MHKAVTLGLSLSASTTLLMLAVGGSVAHADSVSIVKKRAWSTDGQSGYIISYRHDGKLGKNAKVYCLSVGKPIYLIEGLDRGDGKKIGIMVGDESGGLATTLAPGYMIWAIDIWRLTCR